MQIGEKVEFTPDESRTFEILHDKLLDAKRAFAEASRNLRESDQALWAAIFAVRPDLIRYKSSYDVKTGIVTIIGIGE